MLYIRIDNLSRPLDRPLLARLCNSFGCRLRGFTFRREVDEDQALLLDFLRNNRFESTIHMLFVFFDLAVIWIDSEGFVVDVCIARSWRPVYIPRQPARYVLEAHPRRLIDFKIGDQIQFNENIST